MKEKMDANNQGCGDFNDSMEGKSNVLKYFKSNETASMMKIITRKVIA